MNKSEIIKFYQKQFDEFQSIYAEASRNGDQTLMSLAGAEMIRFAEVVNNTASELRKELAN